jgi:transposase-like protein
MKKSIPKQPSPTGQHKTTPLHDKEWLTNAYSIKKQSISSIAKEVGVDKSTVAYWIKSHGIIQRISSKRTSNGHFQKDTHWREETKLWNKEWLFKQYIIKQRSMQDIATEMSVSEPAVRHWIQEHNIESRDISEARKIKYWGASGEDNPMWNKRGELSPNWKGGFTPDRQKLYASVEWKTALQEVWERDAGTCQHCKVVKRKEIAFDIHHIIPYATGVRVADPTNLVLLCKDCHKFIHSKKNIESLFCNDIPE